MEKPRKNRRQAPQSRSRKTFQAVLGAAIAIFKGEGPAGLTFAGIAKAAEVSVGAVQFHFASREAIFEAVISHILDDNIAAETRMFEEMNAEFKNVDDFIHDYIERYCDVLRDFHPNFLNSIDIIKKNKILSQKGWATGVIAEARAKSAIVDILARNGLNIDEGRVDAVYHLIFSFVIRELNFPSGPMDSPAVLRRRRALGTMCIDYLIKSGSDGQ